MPLMCVDVWWVLNLMRQEFDDLESIWCDVKIWISYVYVDTSLSARDLHGILCEKHGKPSAYIASGTLHSSHALVNWFRNLLRGLLSCSFDMSGLTMIWSMAQWHILSHIVCTYVLHSGGLSEQHLGLQLYNKWFANISAWMRVSLLIFVCRCL